MKNSPTKKLYFGQYDHKLVINARHRPSGDKIMPTMATIEWLHARSGLEGKITSAYGWQNDISTVTVFAKDLQLINHLRELILPKYQLELESPLDEQHGQMLREDGKLITRKTLLYGKYRVSLRVQPTQGANRWVQNYKKIHEIKDWFNEQFAGDTDRAGYHIDARANFHFRDPKDAMLMKLVWGGEAHMKMERIMTFEELERMKA